MNLPTKSEPIALGALVSLVLNAILGLLTAFSIADITADQTAAVFGIANVVVVVVVALKTRSVVYSPATVAQAETEAGLEPPHA